MSFSQQTKDKINGWGAIFRFVTPILVTIALFILTGIKSEIKDFKTETDKRFNKIDLQFSNHLEHHRIFEIAFCERLTKIETIARRLR